jgi:hypothetical protein
MPGSQSPKLQIIPLSAFEGDVHHRRLSGIQIVMIDTETVLFMS